jgi:hypothetical protein
MGVSLAIIPVYYALGVDALTYACAAYCGVTLAMCYLRNWRGHEHRAYAQMFLGATLGVMLAGLYLGNEAIDNKPWQMVFPIVAFLVAGARGGAWWMLAAWLASALVFVLRGSDDHPLSIVLFLLAYATLSVALYAFTRSNERNLSTIHQLSHGNPR